MQRFIILIELTLLFWAPRGWCQSAARQAGYLYLSPVPQASYVSAQNRYVLVRLVNVAPAAVTNLTQDFITVTGATSGPHSGTARLATDNRTVIFSIGADFTPNELVTVQLNPQVQPGAAGSVAPFNYQFMVTAPMPGSWPIPTAAPPTAARTQPPAKNLPLRPRISATPGRSGPVRKAMILSNGVSVPSDFPTTRRPGICSWRMPWTASHPIR